MKKRKYEPPFMTAQDYFQGVAENQIPYPDTDKLMDGLRLKLSYDLYECITDEQIEELKNRVKFARQLNSKEPIF